MFPYGEMRVGVDASYPPFAVATADDLFGLDIDLGREIARRLNVPVRFVNMGYDGIYDSLKADQVDVVISALLMDSSRTNDVFYTLPYYNAGFVLVSDAAHTFDRMSDLSGHSLAFEFGSDADTLARDWLRRIPPFDTRPYELPTYALDAVRLGDADAALVDATSARLYLRDHPDWNAQMHTVTDSLYAAAVRINRGKTWEAINYALQTMMDDGTLAEIVKRWL
ncbi:MAG: transporter substrate-binding domain-containing protein [Candidatus Methanoperedens sp.]|nr:transporter substrate-binding domain-containing protein [Candidatus Methanoperedens sp.]